MRANKQFLRMSLLYMVVNVTVKSCFSEKCTFFLQGRGALQDIDQMSLFKPLCKFCATVTKVRDIAPTLRKALHAAQSGTPGLLDA